LGQQETNVPAAYDAFLRGWQHYRRTTPDDFAKSIDYFEEAIRLDPDYGRPYAALAMVYFLASDRKWWSNLGISSWESQQRTQQYTLEAEKRPTSTSHQVRGLQAQHAGEMYYAIGELKEAIALDPSDSWSYAYLAWSQMASGRATEALTNIKTAIRLDPYYPPAFVQILGVVQLSLGQFDEAAVSLERATELSPDDEYPFVALAAAYGYLGRKSDGMAAVARYNDIRIARGGIPLTVAAAPSLTLSRHDPNTLVKKGLRLAGVPENHQSSEFAGNRLAADEIRSLFYGHRLRGRTFETGEEHTAVVSAAGEAAVSGDWGEFTDATVTFEDNEICFASEGGARLCATVLRNPGGSKTKENEFILLDVTGGYPFSQVE
jgi:adenylate cyclase